MVGEGDEDHCYWGPPELYPDFDDPGSDVCASTAAALCTSYLNFKDEVLQFYYTSDYDEDELAWAAVWLYECTGDMKYINDIVAVDETGNYVGYMKRIIPETFGIIHGFTVGMPYGNELFPENELFDFIARWNVEYLSGGKCPHEDPNENHLLPATQ